MANRVTSVDAEVLVHPSPTVRVSAVDAEVLVRPNPTVRATAVAIEILTIFAHVEYRRAPLWA